jgi:hypothetical protein
VRLEDDVAKDAADIVASAQSREEALEKLISCFSCSYRTAKVIYHLIGGSVLLAAQEENEEEEDTLEIDMAEEAEWERLSEDETRMMEDL